RATCDGAVVPGRPPDAKRSPIDPGYFPTLPGPGNSQDLLVSPPTTSDAAGPKVRKSSGDQLPRSRELPRRPPGARSAAPAASPSACHDRSGPARPGRPTAAPARSGPDLSGG